MLRRALPFVLLAALAGGCSLFQAPAEPVARAAERLYAAPVPYAKLHAVAANPADSPLEVRENGLAGLALGATMKDVRARFGPPDAVHTDARGTWWSLKDPGAHVNLRVLFAGQAATLSQIQAWAPGRAETRTLLRPLDPAVRLDRKYGAPDARLPWGTGEAWVYAEANVAYVLTPKDADGARAIAAVIVGL